MKALLAKSRSLTGPFIVIVTLFLAFTVGGSAFWGRYLAQPGPLSAETQVAIPAGSSVGVIAETLQTANVIAHPKIFKLAVKTMGLTGTLKAGEYTFEPRISLRSTINKLAIGETKLRTVTIPEGWTVSEALAVLSREDIGLTGVGPIPTEGTLFPDTYAFNLGTKRESLLKTIQGRAATELQSAWDARTPHPSIKTKEEMLILASIVEKEAASEAEMPQIASVFLNRLDKGMRLQADATIIYGMHLVAAYKGNITKSDLRDPTNPYNSYTHDGLPPTPISNPGRAALRAVAQPASTTALFFVADPSLTHHLFADTYAEHKRNVEYFLKGNK